MAVIDWVAILAGFGSAVLASMGMGGGSILILYLTLIAGVPQREAQGVNLLFFLPIGAAALWLHWRQGRVDKTAVRQFLPTGLLGALLGTGLAMLADDSMDGGALAKAAEHLEEPELLELKRVYGAQAARRFPPVPQLRSRGAAKTEDETEFLI